VQTEEGGTGLITTSMGNGGSKKATLKIEGKVPVEKYGFDPEDELIETDYGYLAHLHTTTASDGIRFTEELPNRIVVTCEVPSLFLLDDEPSQERKNERVHLRLESVLRETSGNGSDRSRSGRWNRVHRQMARLVVALRSPYQSLTDWVFGRWTCPECGQVWRNFGMSFFSDCVLVTVKDGEISKRRVECPGCGFTEILG